MTEPNAGPQAGETNPPLAPVALQVPEPLCRAFHRCTWLLVHETGRSQLEIMEEMVRDFLIKHGC